MYLLNKHIDTITEDDIKRLRDNSISESKILDYKMELKFGGDEDKKEFLADVTAMANTEGGVIIYGIEEGKDATGQNTGIASKIVGNAVANKDKLVQQIEDTIRSNTDPKINSIGINVITVEGIEILLVGVNKFIGFPHMVTFKGTNKFYKRRNSGKYPVDTSELNDLFMNNFLLKEKANKFAKDRIEEVRNGMIVPVLDLVGSFFLHVIPLAHLGENFIDITSIKVSDFLTSNLRPLHSRGWNNTHNLDGYLTHTLVQGQNVSYCQFFRDGSIEFYTSQFHAKLQDQDIYQIFGLDVEYLTIEAINKAIEVYAFFKIEPPYVVFLSIFDTEKSFISPSHRIGNSKMVVARKSIQPPPTVLISTNVDIWQSMKPTFDMIWQAGGYPKSPYYKDDGSRHNV